jgi:hypothetical protein
MGEGGEYYTRTSLWIMYKQDGVRILDKGTASLTGSAAIGEVAVHSAGRSAYEASRRAAGGHRDPGTCRSAGGSSRGAAGSHRDPGPCRSAVGAYRGATESLAPAEGSKRPQECSWRAQQPQHPRDPIVPCSVPVISRVQAASPTLIHTSRPQRQCLEYTFLHPVCILLRSA